MEGEQGVQGLQDAAAAQASKELQAFLAEGDHTQGGAAWGLQAAPARPGLPTRLRHQ